MGSSDIILKADHLRTIPLKIGPNRPSCFREVFKNIFHIGSYVKTMLANGGHLRGRAASSDTTLIKDHLCTFHQSQVIINQPVSEENIFQHLFRSTFKLCRLMAAILVGG